MPQIQISTEDKLNTESARFLDEMVQKYFWWDPPEKTQFPPGRIIVQVMSIGTWEDMAELEQKIDRPLLVKALKRAGPQIINERSWHYWHYRLNIVAPDEEVPKLPQKPLS